MYIGKAKQFQKAYLEENCASGVTTTTINGMSVGTPCIAIIDPFVACEHKLGNNKYGSWAKQVRGDMPQTSRDSGRPRFTKQAPSYSPKSPVKKTKDPDKNDTKAIDLYDMDIKKANNIIHNSLNKINLLFLHNQWTGDGRDYSSSNFYASSFHFTGIKPIIYDTCLRVVADRLEDIHTSKDLKSLCSIVSEQLKEYRYVNYVLNNVVKSNVGDRLRDLAAVKDALLKGFPNKICFFGDNASNCRSLIDTISISFYDLSDTIAIFDSKRSRGVCMEVFALSSAVKDPTYPNKTMTWRFLFSKHRDNVFTIDGESIKRPCDMSIKDGFHYIERGLVKNVANDAAKKNKKMTANR